MARPLLPPEERREDRLNLRLTSAEKLRLEHQAAVLGITLADYMRDRGLGHRMPYRAAERQADAQAITALNRIGVNLNQLARHANAGWMSPGTDAALQTLIGEIHTAMRGLIHDPQADRRGPRL